MALGEKKDPGKFTVRLNIADPQQRIVVELLNQQGRYKAQFLVNAILHYIHCPETPDVYSKLAGDHVAIEDIVRSVLAQQLREGTVQEPLQNGPKIAELHPAQISTETDADDLWEAADRDAIIKTLDAFRPK